MGAKSKQFTTKQLRAIELLASEPDMTTVEIAAQLKCSTETLRKWRQNPAFADKVVLRAREILRERLTKVYKVLGEKAETGNPAHLKILLDHQERLEEMRTKATEGTITFTWKLPERDTEETPLPQPEEEDSES